MRSPALRSFCSLVLCLFGLIDLYGCRSVPPDPPPTEAEQAVERARLVEGLRAEGIRDQRVLGVIGRVPRHLFVLPQDLGRAYVDRALPIAGGQTISQPYVVALMTELLELRGPERVLEIGTGSGYQAAVLSLLAREVYSIEIDASLADAAQQRLQQLGYNNVSVRAGDGFYGWEEAAPFDAVIVTASAPRVPERLVAQLKTGGRLAMPLGNDLHQTLIRARKREAGLQIEEITGVLFVPMTGEIRRPAGPTPKSGPPTPLP